MELRLENVSKQVANSRSVEMLKAVAIPRAETRMDDYPCLLYTSPSPRDS